MDLVLSQALFLAVLNLKIVEYLIVPLFDKLGWDKFWLLYVAFGTGLVICLLAGIDLMAAVKINFVSPWVGKVLTAILVGGGSNLIHDVLDKK